MTTQTDAAKPATVTEAQKRTIECPHCGARRGKACRGSRIPGAHTFGGGWGGPPDLDRAHNERRVAYLEAEAHAAQARKARLQLVGACVKMHAAPGDADARAQLTAALSAYEATGDHNHGAGKLAVGAACAGGDCIVAEARALLTPAPLVAGERVRVRIVDKTLYAQGAGDALDGCEGVIERFKADGEALVKFDKPAPTWWSNQLPWGAGWFPPCDLVRLDGGGV